MAHHSAVAVASARLRLLGGWQLLVHGAEVALGHREQRLVALLGLVDHSARAQVASVLWPESTDERALASLRRAVLQCQKKCPGLLVAGRLTITLDPGVQVDVDDLRRAAGLTQLPMTDDVAHELLDALRGEELLPGWYDDWAVEERGRLQQLRVESLERVSLHALERGDLVLAIEAARSASDIEPLRESTREVSIRAHLGRGDASSALTEFQRYSAVMRQELGVAPSSSIVALLEPLLDEGAGTRAPPTLPRQRVAPPQELVPEEQSHPADEAEGAASRVRSAGAALVGAAGVALAVALAIAVAGPDGPREAPTDLGMEARLANPLPASPEQDSGSDGQGRTVRVRAVESAAGSAAFAVRATLRPAQVRLVVRGPGGLRVVRHLVVRGADGREVVVDGLDPGTYRWSATSASASPVQGELSVTTASAAAKGRPEATPSASVTPDVTQVVSTPSQAPTPSQTPTPSPTPSPTSSPVPSPTPSPTASHTPTRGPSPSPSPTGTPTDPGTVAPTPVG